MVTVILGMQFGDEGKGKISHYLAKDHSIGVRFNGGPNAGHTVYHKNKKVITHLLPATALYNRPSVIAPGVLIDTSVLIEDILETQIHIKHLFIDHKCPIIEKPHKAQDKTSGGEIGTTGRGIGPCMQDQAARTGNRAGDPYDIGRHDTVEYLHRSMNAGRKILCEGAQGHYLDLWHGTYPYVTSSMCTVGAVCTNAGIPPQKITRVIGVFKAYSTRVGNGPFRTELGSMSINKSRIATQGQEFGSTTGRPRRIGWLDLIDLKKACEFNGVTELAMTKVDVLNDFNKIGVAIDRKVDGNAIYTHMEGWHTVTDRNLEQFIGLIEEFVGVPITIVSYGPQPKYTLKR